MIYLASKSPQRKALLESLGVDFEVVLPEYREHDLPGESPDTLVERHSRGKALSVLPRVAPRYLSQAILGVDTMVVLEGEALGKPADEKQARSYLRMLSGKTHEVYSGVTLILPGEKDQPGDRAHLRQRTGHSVTLVRLAELSREDLDAYLALGEWRQRAGAYAIQGRASAFVQEVRGDYANVVGLPVPLLVSFMREADLWPPVAWGRKVEP